MLCAPNTTNECFALLVDHAAVTRGLGVGKDTIMNLQIELRLYNILTAFR